MKFCMVGGLKGIVLRLEFHQPRLSGFRAVGVEIYPFPEIYPIPLTWPLAYTAAYTTGYTTAQAVIILILF